jgi:hypothetical protein
MFFERIAVGERFVTHATDKRFLLGVYSKMFHQIASVSKCIATCWTMIIAIVPWDGRYNKDAVSELKNDERKGAEK